MKVIVTGADGALGRAVVRRFRLCECRVAALGRRSDGDEPDDLHYAAGDLADEANARRVIGRAAEDLGGLDSLVHLVGGFAWTEVGSAALSDWRAMFESNVATAVASVGAALPLLKSGGAIVLVGAHSAEPAGRGLGPYGAAKAGVARLTEALAAELRPQGIRVNAVLPSVIDTPRNRADMPDADPADWTSPEAIADTIFFLSGPAARAITGALVPVTNAQGTRS